MHPQPLHRAHITQVVCCYDYLVSAHGAQGQEVVEGAGAGGAEGGYQAEGDQPPGLVLCYGRGENITSETENDKRVIFTRVGPATRLLLIFDNGIVAS